MGFDRRGSWVFIEQWRSGGSWVLIEQWIPHGWTVDFGFGLVGLGWCGDGVVVVTVVGGWKSEKQILEKEEIRERSKNIFILFLFYFVLF